MNSRYVICSMTSSGLETPPYQKASQTRSILLFNSPVITAQATSGVVRIELDRIVYSAQLTTVAFITASQPTLGAGWTQ
jgi:hypothetical protein